MALACGDSASVQRGADSELVANEPTATQVRQAQDVRDYVDALKNRTACTAPVDWTKLSDDSATAVLTGDGSDREVFRALLRVQLAVPEGHQGLSLGSCGQPGAAPYANSTWFGTCGRPYADGVVVTSTSAESKLGLSKGDVVIGTDRHAAGKDFLENIALEPLCGASVPTTSARIERAAASLFGIIEPGMTLTVRAPSGAIRTVTVPEREAQSASCSAPFGGFEDFEATVTTRPDGLAVVRVPGFMSSAYPLPVPTTAASYKQWVDAYVERLRVALEPVKDAPGIIWDARSNHGGAAEVALAIVGGFATATSGVVSNGFQRLAGTFPFAYQANAVSSYSFSVTAGGPLVTTGKIAVLVDGLTYSAGDFFAYGARHFSKALIVGRPSAGAYGFGGYPTTSVAGPPHFSFSVDAMKSTAPDGKALDGVSVMPDIAVEYGPGDLAMNVDTVLETAAAALRK